MYMKNEMPGKITPGGLQAIEQPVNQPDDLPLWGRHGYESGIALSVSEHLLFFLLHLNPLGSDRLENPFQHTGKIIPTTTDVLTIVIRSLGVEVPPVTP
jgi:hypothetical protein